MYYDVLRCSVDDIRVDLPAKKIKNIFASAFEMWKDIDDSHRCGGDSLSFPKHFSGWDAEERCFTGLSSVKCKDKVIV